MADRKCETCGLEYDDTYRWTYCPHEPFGMRCLTMRADGQTRLCESIEEQDAFLHGRINEGG